MAQYDVYTNPNKATRDMVPLLVDVQSALLDQVNTRLTLPLVKFEAHNAGLPRRLVPRIRLGEQTYVLYAHQAAAIQAKLLKKPVANLKSQSTDIVNAIDAVISGV